MKNLRNEYLRVLILSTPMLPFTANGVERSEGEMPKEMYQDYFVQLEINTLAFGQPIVTSCAGTLVGGEYVITAHHCVSESDDYTMKIIQGYDTANPDAVYDNVSYEVHTARNIYQVCQTYDVAHEVYKAHVEGQYINELGRDVVNVLSPEYTDPDLLQSCYDYAAENPHLEDGMSFHYDIAILKLDRVIDHADAPVLAKTFTVEKGENLAIGEEVTFFGRGVLANGTTPSVPQKATLTRESSRFWPVGYRVTDELDSMGEWMQVEEPCSTDPEVMNDVNYHCRYDATWHELYFNPTNSVSLGDSGSPFMHDGKVYGVVSGYENWNQENTNRRSRIISFSYLEEWLKETFDGLSYPTQLVMDGTQDTTLDITVQNFSNETVMPDQYQGDFMTGLAITQACSAELEPFESCTVSLSVDAELLAIEDDLEVVIPFTQSEQFVVTLQGPVEVTEEVETETPDTTEPETDIEVTEEVETETPDATEPETDVEVTEEVETETPDTTEPETDVEVTEEVETETPVTTEPETDVEVTEEVETDAPVTNEPETDVEVTEEVETDTPDTGKPETGEAEQESDESTETDQAESETDAEVTETEETEGESSEEIKATTKESDSGGGSVGWFALLALAGLARFRLRG